MKIRLFDRSVSGLLFNFSINTETYQSTSSTEPTSTSYRESIASNSVKEDLNFFLLTTEYLNGTSKSLARTTTNIKGNRFYLTTMDPYLLNVTTINTKQDRSESTVAAINNERSRLFTFMITYTRTPATTIIPEIYTTAPTYEYTTAITRQATTTVSPTTTVTPEYTTQETSTSVSTNITTFSTDNPITNQVTRDSTPDITVATKGLKTTEYKAISFSSERQNSTSSLYTSSLTTNRSSLKSSFLSLIAAHTVRNISRVLLGSGPTVVSEVSEIFTTSRPPRVTSGEHL